MAASAQAASLLVNGSFESPGCAGNCILGGGSTAITGWTTVLTGVEYFVPSLYGIGGAPDGVMVVDLANYVYSAGGIEQSFATVAGQHYTVSFFAGNVKTFGRTGDGDVRVEAGDLDVVVPTAVATDGHYAWKSITLDFQALAATTTLRFTNTQDAYTHFAFIDGVAATPVPEPGAWALMAGGLIGVAGVARRRT